MGAPAVDVADRGGDSMRLVRPRDANGTRRLLLDAAKRRFALDGYSATTVREIAADAGVNVALINRYFASKEGLFEACLRRVIEDIDRPDEANITIERIAASIVAQIVDQPVGEHSVEMLLLVRSSGDERADLIRRDTIRSFTEDMARAAGWSPDRADGDRILLRAQVALSAAFGIVLMRSSTALRPLSSATADELREPLDAVLTTLLRS